MSGAVASGAGPTFSVIVPAFNAEARIEGVMGSVLGQSRPDLELIVVDDGSVDGTAERAERVAAADRRVRFVRQANRGTVGARNAGIELARGPYVSFLDDDDLWLPGYLERVGGLLERSPGAGLGFSDAWVVDADGGRVGRRSAFERFARPLRRLPVALEPAAAEAALVRANFITTCATTVRRAAVERVGALDPGIRGSDDWDLWLRVVGAGFGIVRVAERLAVLRKRAASVSADEPMMARGSRKALGLAIGRGLQSERAAAIARRHLRLIDAEIAAAGRSAPRRALARIGRRLGRKRLPPLGRRWRSAPPELEAALAAASGGQAGAQPDSSSSAKPG